MAYLLSISYRAERDLSLLYEQIDADNSMAARRWYMGLKKSILTLERHPNRCPVMRTTGQLRHLLYGRKPHVYRVIYRVLEKAKRVEVLAYSPGARSEPKPSDLA